jgi:hypothetical protein
VASPGHLTAAPVAAKVKDSTRRSREGFDVVNRLLRLGTVLVIGIDIGGADDPRSVDDEPSGHWQSPAALAVAHHEIIAEAEIDRLQSGSVNRRPNSAAYSLPGSDSRSNLIRCFSIRDRLASASCGVIATILAPYSFNVPTTCCKAYSSATQ